MDLPDDFRCPISLEVMTDPVILTSGHTFDRASIQRWLDAGNLTCPLTNLTLTPTHEHSPIITPNLALRRLIRNSVSTPPLSPNSLPYPSDPQSLSSLLKSIQKSAEFRQRVSESNLVRSLLRHVADARRPDAQKLAIHSVLYLSLDGDDAKVGLVAEGAVDSLITAVNSNGAASAAAATAITSLATVDVNKVTIGAHPAAISSLAAMLLEGSTRREKKEAATAIYELCKFSENRRRVIRVGAVRSLVRLAGLGLDRAIEILGQLAKVKEGREEMGKDRQFVRALVGVMRSGTSRGVESAVSVMSLVCGDERICLEAVNEGILEVLEKLCEGESRKIAKNAMGVLDKLKKLKKEEF